MNSKILTKSEMNSFFFEDPKHVGIKRNLENVIVKYFYFETELNLKSGNKEVINGSLLLGNGTLIRNKNEFDLFQFDMFFIPPKDEILIKCKPNSKNKIILVYSSVEREVDTNFEIQSYNLKNFIPRGEFGSINKMSTFRTVWTAFKNGFFMSGMTNIPSEALKTGVVTSVNLEKNNKDENIKVYAHIHPDFPELYLFLINDEKYAVTQYLINSEGDSVCKNLSNGSGVFFPGHLGHINFARPYYKTLQFCAYMWIIPTFGIKTNIEPITLKI